MKKAMALVLSLALFAVMLAGCNPKEASTASNAEGKIFKIGILQMDAHPALDAAYEGFVAALKEAGYEDGVNVKLDLQNAQGKIANCSTLASKLVNDGSDLILAIATPAAQAVATLTSEIPIVVTAVTDPADAKLVETNEKPGRNVTGTSDMGPIRRQIELFGQLVPDAKTIGILYSSNESNSILQAKMANEIAAELGYKTKDYTVSNTNDIQQVVGSMVGKVDAIYCPTDNVIAKAMPTVATLALENKLAIIGGEEAQVTSGALASFSVSYFELGKLAAGQAITILEGKDTPANMPVLYQENVSFSYNEETAKALGITIPQELLDQM